MVWQGIESFRGQVFHQFFGVIAGKPVDDDRLVLVLVQEFQETIEGISLRLDRIAEIGAVEAGDEYLRLP